MGQKEKQNRLCLANGMAANKTNLKEGVIMVSNSDKKKYNKFHVIIAVIIIIIAGGGLTKEKVYVEAVNPDNAVNPVEKVENPDSNSTSGSSIEKYRIEEIFHDFINNKIKSRPEWKKWKGNTNKLYFSIQYTVDDTPCLLVTKDIITNTNEAMNSFIYYYDEEAGKIQLLTYLASNGTSYPVSMMDGEFVISSNHSIRSYSWEGGDMELYAQEVDGYYMYNGKYTYSSLSWKVPFKSKKLKLDARKYNTKKQMDACANKIKKIKNFSKSKAKDFEKMYSGAVPVPFYINKDTSWKKFIYIN